MPPAGIAVGGAIWAYGSVTGQLIAEPIAPYLIPFGTVLVNMLKMIVVPVVFFSLLYGSASLSVSKLDRVGGKTIGWYILTSVIAAGYIAGADHKARGWNQSGVAEAH